MKTILTLTLNPALDLSASVDQVAPNHKLRCGPMRSDPGGGGINVSRVVKRLGGESLALHCCGGPTGEMVRALLDAEEVEHRGIPIHGWTRQSVTIFENSTGHQYRFVMPGPELSENEWRQTLAFLRHMPALPDLVVASGSLSPGVPDDFYAQLARIVRECGSKLILDTSGPALEAALREGVFLIKPSLRELKKLASVPIENEADQSIVAMDIITSGKSEAVVVSLGAAGVLLASEEGCCRLHAPVVSVNSRVGAGDSMVAGITLALANEQPFREAVRYGIAAGTAAVMNAGTELCHKKDVEKLYKQINDEQVIHSKTNSAKQREEMTFPAVRLPWSSPDPTLLLAQG